MSRQKLYSFLAALLVCAGLVTLAAPVASAGPGGSYLAANERLNPGERLWTVNGISLVMQSDGNLVEYAPGNRAVWASNTNKAGSIVVMQPDGNLVIIAPGNVAVWSTRTGGNPGATLELQTDGNLVVYGQGHVARWANGVRVTVATSPPGGPAGDAFRLVNEERARRGCGPLQIEDRLQRASQDFAVDMASRGYWPADSNHQAQDPYPRYLGDRLRAAGFTSFTRAGENLGRGAIDNAQQIVQAWINSPGHLANLAECRYQWTGVGYDGRNGARWVQMFAY
jgi:hypothetical protein